MLRQTLRRGVAATVLMSASFLARPRLSPPPKIVAFNTARRLGVRPEDLSPLLRNGYWIVAHLGFGTALTALDELLPGRRRGAAYGLAVWLAHYGFALPKLELYPAPVLDDPVRAVAGFVGHIIFGASLQSLKSASRSRIR